VVYKNIWTAIVVIWC